MKLRYILFVSVVFALSCTKEINISIPNDERKIVLNALLETDSVIEAFVFRSNHAQDDAVSLLYFNNAIVDVYKDEQFLETLPLAIDSLGRYRSVNHVVEQGSIYEFVVNVPNLEPVKGKALIVPEVPIIRIDSIGQTNLYDDGTIYNVYNIVFQDIEGVDNFYRLSFDVQDSTMIVVPDTTWYDYDSGYGYSVSYNEPYVNIIDPAVEVWSYLDDYCYLSDNLFDGEEYGFEVAVPFYQDINTGFYVSLEHITPDFFLYMKSVSAQDETKGNPLFYQAVQVYLNVEGGFGIVGSAVADVDSILYDIDESIWIDEEESLKK